MKATKPVATGLGAFWDSAHTTAIRKERAMIALCRVSGYISPPAALAPTNTNAGR